MGRNRIASPKGVQINLIGNIYIQDQLTTDDTASVKLNPN
jgi:hypothetical protein